MMADLSRCTGIDVVHLRGGRGPEPVHHGRVVPDKGQVVEFAQIQAEAGAGQRVR